MVTVGLPAHFGALDTYRSQTMHRQALSVLVVAAAISPVALCKVATSSTPTPATAAADAGEKLPASALPLKFIKHEHVALVGNSLAERMNLFGNFESLLHSRFPQLELVLRNFARPCDAVDARQRPSNY